MTAVFVEFTNDSQGVPSMVSSTVYSIQLIASILPLLMMQLIPAAYDAAYSIQLIALRFMMAHTCAL